MNKFWKFDSIDDLIKKIIYLVFLLLLIEGALRKWIFPGLSSPLFFIKDVFILYSYFLAFRYRKFPSSPFLSIALLLCISIYVLVCIQVFWINYEIYVGIYGWRNYCLYIPFAFIIAKYYGMEEMKSIAKLTCIAAIPIAALVYTQYKSPKDAFINKNVGYDDSEVFTVGGGIVRPSGPFSFTTGMSNYTAILFIMLLFNYYLGRKAFLHPYVFYLCIFSFFVCLATSGSRGSYLTIMLEASSLIFASLFLIKKKQGFRIIASTTLLVVIAVLMFVFVFDTELEIIQTRQETAQQQEGSIILRGLSTIIDYDVLYYADLTFLGSGIGLGSGGGAYLATGSKGFILAETEWARHILEAGIIVGLFYILFRISLCITLLKGAIVGLSRTSSPIPLMFFSGSFLNLLSGPITGNGITYSFTWIFLGFSLAINKIYSKNEQSITKFSKPPITIGA